MLCGCGAGNAPAAGRYPVTGTVTLDGVPLDTGLIQFFPIGAAEVNIIGGALIKDGHYTLPPQSLLAPGKYFVRITSVPPAPELPQDPAAAMEAAATAKSPVDRIPGKYNIETGLTCEVTKQPENTANFDLKSQPAES